MDWWDTEEAGAGADALSDSGDLLIEQAEQAAINSNLLTVPVHEDYLDLFGAVQAGNLAAVFRFLDTKGIDLEQRSSVDGLTPLLLAADTGNLSIVEVLLNRGADIDATDEQGRTALFLATERGHEDIVSLLLEKGCDTEVTDDLLGQTPLLRSASMGQSKMCVVLLNHGADPFYQDMEGHTANDLAVDQVTKTVVSNSQQSAASTRSSLSDLPFVDLTKRSYVERSPSKHQAALRTLAESLVVGDYFAAVREGDVDRVTSLLDDHDKGNDGDKDGGATVRWRLVDVEEDVMSGRTALALAAAQGHVGVVETLLRHGAAIDKCGARVGNKTALFFAAAHEHEATVALLLQHGADTELCSSSEGEEGWTPLMAAAAAGNLPIVNLLVQHGARTDTVDMEGRTAVDLSPDAAMKEQLRLIDEQRRQQQAEQWANQQLIMQQQQQQEQQQQELEARRTTSTTAVNEAKASIVAAAGEEEVVPSQPASQRDNDEVFDDADADAASLYQLSGSVGEVAAGDSPTRDIVEPVFPSVHAPVKSVVGPFQSPPAAAAAAIEAATKPALAAMATVHNENGGGNSDEMSVHSSLYQLSGSVKGEDAGQPAAVNANLLTVPVHEDYLDLFGAVQAGNLAAVFRFLDTKGIDLEQRSSVDGLTPLLLAADTGNLSIVEVLLNRGADIDATDEQGRTALFLATERGHEDIVSLLLEKGCDTEVTDDLLGQTPLLRSASMGQSKMCVVLLNHGADPFYQDMEGHTANDLAVDQVTKTVVSNSQQSAASTRSSLSDLPFVDLTKRSYVERSPSKHQAALRTLAESLVVGDYFAAVREGDVDRVTSLLDDHDKGNDGDKDGGATVRWRLVDVEEDVMSGRTALALAAAQGHVGVVETLLRHGAAIDKCGARVGNKTALFFAAAHEHEATAALLLQHGADTELCCTSDGEEGWTPLMAAAATGNLPIVNLLVQHGARTDTVDMEGRTAVDLSPDAAMKEQLRLIDEQRRQQQAEQWANQQLIMQQQQEQAAAEAKALTADTEAGVGTRVSADNDDIASSQPASQRDYDEVFDDDDAADAASSLYQLSGSIKEAADAVTTKPALTTTATVHSDNDDGNGKGDEGSVYSSLFQLSGSVAGGDAGGVMVSAKSANIEVTNSYESVIRPQSNIPVKSDRAQSSAVVGVPVAAVAAAPVTLTSEESQERWEGHRKERQREGGQSREGQVVAEERTSRNGRPPLPAATTIGAAATSVLPLIDDRREGGLSTDNAREEGLSMPSKDDDDTAINPTGTPTSTPSSLSPRQDVNAQGPGLGRGSGVASGPALVQGPPDRTDTASADATRSFLIEQTRPLDPPPVSLADTSRDSSLLLPIDHEHDQGQWIGQGVGLGQGVALGLLPSSSVCSAVVYGETVVVVDEEDVDVCGGGGGGGGNRNDDEDGGGSRGDEYEEERFSTASTTGSGQDRAAIASSSEPHSAGLHPHQHPFDDYNSTEGGVWTRHTARASARDVSHHHFAGTRPNPSSSLLPMVWDGEMGDKTTHLHPRFGMLKMFKNKERKPISGRQVITTTPTHPLSSIDILCHHPYLSSTPCDPPSIPASLIPR